MRSIIMFNVTVLPLQQSQHFVSFVWKQHISNWRHYCLSPSYAFLATIFNDVNALFNLLYALSNKTLMRANSTFCHSCCVGFSQTLILGRAKCIWLENVGNSVFIDDTSEWLFERHIAEWHDMILLMLDDMEIEKTQLFPLTLRWVCQSVGILRLPTVIKTRLINRSLKREWIRIHFI